MKKILSKVIIFTSGLFGGKYAGKMIGLFNFCREVICNNEKVFAGQIHKRMNLDNIIPRDNEIKQNSSMIGSSDKIKVRIVYPSGCSWNNIHSLYDEFSKDDRYQTYVLVRNETRFIEIMKRVGCKYAILDNYDVKQDHPNILIATYYSFSDPEISFPGCHKYIGKVYAAIPNIVMNEKDNEIHWRYISNAFKYLEPDCYISSPLVYDSLKGYVDDGKLFKMGNPQFDELYNEVGHNRPIPESWEKLKGKKVFLWATDHGINESYPKNGFTVDLYIKDMIDYFKNHNDIALIFRPHPEFIREMQKKGNFWKAEDVQQLKNYMLSTDNMVWDDTHDFCCAFNLCSALIVDANCSLTCSFLTTNKPICRLMRYDMEEWLISPQLYDSYYYAKDFKQCIDFFNMIVLGKDDKKEKRNEGAKMSIMNYDGQNGKRMKIFIENNYNNSL